MKLVACPWSAPGWMKSTDSLYGGSLLDGAEYLDALAEYFVRFIQAYEDEGTSLLTSCASSRRAKTKVRHLHYTTRHILL